LTHGDLLALLEQEFNYDKRRPGEYTLKELAAQFGETEEHTRAKLRKFKSLGRVTDRKAGRVVYYRMA
jgi:hypothetical protein